MKAIAWIFFFVIVALTWWGLLGYYGDLLLDEYGWERSALTDTIIVAIPTVHLWLLHHAFNCTGGFVSPKEKPPYTTVDDA